MRAVSIVHGESGAAVADDEIFLVADATPMPGSSFTEAMLMGCAADCATGGGGSVFGTFFTSGPGFASAPIVNLPGGVRAADFRVRLAGTPGYPWGNRAAVRGGAFGLVAKSPPGVPGTGGQAS